MADEYLRRLKRLAANDPSLKDHYIRALERAIGVGDDEDCKGMVFTSDGRRLNINNIKISNPNDGLIVGFHSYGEYGNGPKEYNVKTRLKKELKEWAEKWSRIKRSPQDRLPPKVNPLVEAIGNGYKLIDPIVPDSERMCPIYQRMVVDTILEFHTNCCWYYSQLRLMFLPTYDELKLSPQILIEREMEKLNWYELAMEVYCD